MTPDLILNELSYHPPADNLEAGRQRIRSLIGLIVRCRKSVDGWNPRLRTDEFFFHTELASGFTVTQWIREAPVEERQRLKSLVQNGPILRNLSERIQEALPQAYEFRAQGKVAEGLGFAYLLGGIAVSFQSSEVWNSPHLAMEAVVMGAPDGGDHDGEVQVRHSNRPEHLGEHAAWVSGRVRPAPLDLIDLWRRRTELFPRLLFCDEVEAQFGDMDHRHFFGVLQALSEIHDYAVGWASAGGPFDRTRMLKVTPEHTQRKKTYGHKMTFRCPHTGVHELFELHSRFTPDEGRIHIWPDVKERLIVVGYVGRKIGI